MRASLTVLAVATALLALAPASNAASGSYTVLGSQGKDELEVRHQNSQDPRESNMLIFRPAVAVTPGGQASPCSRVLDPVTGRATETRCPANVTIDLIMDLRAGDDALLVSVDAFNLQTTTLTGGAGNDAITSSAGATQTLRGGDGDDALRAPPVNSSPVAFDGGVGRDLVDYDSGGTAPSGSVRGGVTANLANGTAFLLMARHSTGDITRQDSLAAIERLSGTENGDSLTGSPGADELVGEAGPDLIDGGDGADSLLGGDGEDLLAGGLGTDTIDGGRHIDDFRPSAGGDTIQSRDGYAERSSCVGGEALINDLVDVIDNPVGCRSVSTAAAKHRFDTLLTRKRLRVGARRRVGARLSCPRRKPDTCAGVLRLRLGGPRGGVLARRRYRLRPGRETVVKLALSAAEARRVRGRTVTLDAAEIDPDGRDRRLLRKTRLR